MKIGVLALQGAVREHTRMLGQVGADPIAVKRPHELEDIQGLIIPGGESTTISKLMHKYGLMGPIREKARAGMPVFGTCAGLILLARRIEGTDASHLGLMDITVRRNAFGRQRESFEAFLDVDGVAEAYRAVFIRAPYITKVGPDARVLASFGNRAVIVQQDHLLGASFHPELTDDVRLHGHFIKMVQNSQMTHTV